MHTPTHISVVEFHTITGVPLTEHGVSADYLVALQEMFQDVRVVSTDACDCPCCWDERAKHAAHRYDDPSPACGLCGSTTVPLAPGRTICVNCAHWPLD
jgi:hypothetical protein